MRSAQTLWAILACSSFVLLTPPRARADILDTDGSAADVQRQIDAAADGDTVRLPAVGTFSWATDVSIPSTKYITLDGRNSTITLSAELDVDAHATGNTRVTGFNFECGSSGQVNFSDTPTTAAWRFDHSSMTGAHSPILSARGQGAGLIDNCTFTGLSWAQEFMHLYGWGAVDDTGWTTSVTPGGPSMLIIEDCEFHASTGGMGVAWIQGYYGTRVAMRHNVFDWVSVDMHGTGGNIGARWWEGYENTFTNDSTGSQPSWAFSMRAGSGVLFNNASTGTRTLDIGLCEEDSGYPALYQIGRGTDQVLDPAYVWGNTGGMDLSVDACDAPESIGMVQIGRDVFEMPRPGYTPYVYPHPLRGGIVPSSDAGVPTGSDAGTAATDAGAPPRSDAGSTTPRDAGSTAGTDAGASPAPAPDDGGCGCRVAGIRGAAPSSLVAIFTLALGLALVLRRARSRRP